MDELESPLPADGIEVDVRATFGGSGLFVSKNSLNPSLRLFEDHVEIKIMKTVSFGYDEIESVDAKTGMLTNNLAFKIAGAKRPLTANVRSREDLAPMLRFLDGKEVPLTERAREFKRG